MGSGLEVLLPRIILLGAEGTPEIRVLEIRMTREAILDLP